MNRAAWAARFFFLVALTPTIVAASYAAYKFHTQPPPPPWRQGGPYSPQIVANPPGVLMLGAVAPADRHVGPALKVPRVVPRRVAGLYGFETLIQHRATLSVRYVGWRPVSTFPAKYVISAAALGAETVIELVPNVKSSPTLAEIGAGTKEVHHWLENFAKKAVAPRDHFILSFAPEMNGTWWSYGVATSDINPQRNCKDSGYKYNRGDSPSDYVRAFRYVHRFLTSYFDKHGVRGLARFMWQPSAIHKDTLCPIPWWPGASYVDEIGLDGYFYYPYDTFKFIFGRTLAYLKKVAPKANIMIGETAVGPTVGSSREQADVRSLFAGIRKYRLDGLIWYDGKKVKPKNVVGGVAYQDFRLWSNTAVAETFLSELARWRGFASFSKTFVANGGHPLIPLH